MELPKIFGGRAMPKDDNVTPLRDLEPTQPHRVRPGGYQFYQSGHPPVPVPPRHHYEMDKAKTIFLALVDEPKDARDRISEQVEMLLKQYGADDTTPPEERSTTSVLGNRGLT